MKKHLILEETRGIKIFFLVFMRLIEDQEVVTIYNWPNKALLSLNNHHRVSLHKPILKKNKATELKFHGNRLKKDFSERVQLSQL